MLVGLFEPVAAPWSLDGVPRDFSFGKLPPDWERMEPFLGAGDGPHPVAGRHRGADVLLRPGVVHLRRPAAARPGARAGRLLRRGGPELAGHPVRRRGGQHGRALDRRRGAAGRRDRATPSTGPRPTRRPGGSGPSARSSSSGCCSATRSGRPGSRRPRATCAGRCCTTGWPRRARTSASRRAGSTPSGSPRRASTPRPTPGLPAASRRTRSSGASTRAVREAVGVIDMSLMAKLIVQGPDAAAVLSRLSANDVLLAAGPARLHPVAERIGRHRRRRHGDVAGAEEKFLVVASDIIHRRIEPLIRRATRDGEVVDRHRRHLGHHPAVRAGPGVARAARPADRRRPVQRRVPVPDRAADPRRLRARARRPGHLRRRARLGAARARRVRGRGVRRPDGGRRRPRLPAGRACRPCRACGWRRATATWASTSTTPTTPLEAGLGFAVAWDKPGGFIGRDALLKAREQGPPRHRVVSLIVDDPAADLFGNEPVLADGEWVGYVRAAAYGYTVGGPVGLAAGRLRRRRHRPVAQGGRLPGAHPGRRGPGPAADRAAVRPATAAHPGPLRGGGVRR